MIVKATFQPASLSNLRPLARGGLLQNWLASLISVSVINAVKKATSVSATSDTQAMPDAGCSLTFFAGSCEHGYQDYGYYWTRMIDIRGSNP